jgi:hypothetical protein
MLQPLRSASRRRLLLLAGLSVVGFALYGAWMRSVMDPFGVRILALELAFTPERAARLLAQWGPAGQDAARVSLLVDVGFILAGYAPLLAALCLLWARELPVGFWNRVGGWVGVGSLPMAVVAWVARRFPWIRDALRRWFVDGPRATRVRGWIRDESDAFWTRCGEWLALGALAAGVLDLIENAALWFVIGQPASPSAGATWTAGVAAAVKFALVAAAVVYALPSAARELKRLGVWIHQWTPLAQWFLSYPILLLSAVLLLAVLWHVALVSFGIPDLFWDEDGWMQVWTGLGVGTLLVHFGVMGFLMDTQRANRQGRRYRQAWCARVSVSWAARFLPVTPADGSEGAKKNTDAALVLAGYLWRTSVPMLVLAQASFMRAPGGVSPWPLPLATAVSFGLSFWGIVRILKGTVPVLWDMKAVGRREKNTGLQNVHRLAQLFVMIQAVFAVVLWGLYAAGRDVSVALAVCVLLGALASAYGFLKYFFPGSTFGVIAIAFVAFVAIQALGGHQLPGFDYSRRVKLNRNAAWRQTAAPTYDELGAWLRARGQQPPLVVVAVDGGGIRAAVWANVVMARLERDVPNLPYFVRVVTGASGGMVGMASYVASLQPPDPANPRRPALRRDLKGAPLSPETLIERVSKESLGAVARTLVFKDLILPPFLHPSADRGLALERQWEHDTQILGQPFAALAAGEKEGWRPSLIVSPMIIEDGRRLLISNLELGDLSTIPVASPSLQALQYFGHIESRPGALRLSTAVRLNASFPYVSPATQLPTEPARHTLDAGYYDEHGVELAGTWIWTHRDWLLDNTGGVLLIQIPDARAREAKKQAREDRRDWWGAGILAATGPVEALRTSQSAAADYRNDQLVRFLQDTMNARTPGFFGSVVFEPDETDSANPPEECRRSDFRKLLRRKERPFGEVALSWRLTRCEVKRLQKSIDGDASSQSCKDRKAFGQWWNEHRQRGEPPVNVTCATPPS